jgi:hypothetical protein
MNELSPLGYMKALQPVLLTHFQSSGILYLHSLFDGHPEIISIPGVPSLTGIIASTCSTIQQALDIFNHENPKFYDTSKMSRIDYNASGLYRLGEKADKGILTPRKEFEDHFQKCLEGEDLDPQNIILSLYYAYFKTHKDSFSKKKVVLLHPHNHPLAIQLFHLFPNSKAIVTARETHKAYYSRNTLMKEKAEVRNHFHSHLGLLSDATTHVMPLVQAGLPYKIVRIEDFADHSTLCLSKLCEFVGISYHSSLEESTFCNEIYNGDNPKYIHNKFSKKRHESRNKLSRREELLFSITTGRFNQIMGYPEIELTFFEKLLKPIWLLVPLPEDFEWLKTNLFSIRGRTLSEYGNRLSFIIRTIRSLIKERYGILSFYFKAKNASDQFAIISKSFISISVK